MSYIPIAGKWRPQTFQEVIGQDTATTTLINSLKFNRIPHSVLFTGPKGVGKTSMARILSKAINCKKKENFTPCCQCQICKEIATGSNIDVIEIDGASNSGVEAVRNLIDSAGYSSFNCEFKIYIIDEVHMLSNSAFNALLKILEEPPKHVKFIFATTEHKKIPLTILSRCYRFDLKKISTNQIAQHLELICTKEKIKFEKEAILRIARNSDGSMRDSQVSLDQIISFSRENITESLVEEMLGLTNKATILKAIDCLFKRNIDSNIIKQVSNGSHSPNAFMNDLLVELRNCIMVKEFGNTATLDLSESEIKTLSSIIKESSSEDIHMLFDMALKGASDLTKCENPQIVLEMILIRIANAPKVESLLKNYRINNNVAPVNTGKTIRANKNSKPQNFRNFVDFVEEQNKAHIASVLGNCHFEEIKNDLFVINLDKDKQPVEFKTLEKYKTEVETLIESFYNKKLKLQIQKNSKHSAISKTPNEEIEDEVKKNKDELKKQIESEPVVQDLKKIFNSDIINIVPNKTKKGDSSTS